MWRHSLNERSDFATTRIYVEWKSLLLQAQKLSLQGIATAPPLALKGKFYVQRIT